MHVYRHWNLGSKNHKYSRLLGPHGVYIRERARRWAVDKNSPWVCVIIVKGKTKTGHLMYCRYFDRVHRVKSYTELPLRRRRRNPYRDITSAMAGVVKHLRYIMYTTIFTSMAKLRPEPVIEFRCSGEERLTSRIPAATPAQELEMVRKSGQFYFEKGNGNV